MKVIVNLLQLTNEGYRESVTVASSVADYACPFEIADESCHPDCTCVKPFMSHGCLCCARYGSDEQRKKAANQIVSMFRE